MRRGILIGLLGLGVGACSTKPAPIPPQVPLIYPGARLLYSNGHDNVITLCARGDRIFLSSQGGLAISPGACGLDGLP